MRISGEGRGGRGRAIVTGRRGAGGGEERESEGGGEEGGGERGRVAGIQRGTQKWGGWGGQRERWRWGGGGRIRESEPQQHTYVPGCTVWSWSPGVAARHGWHLH